MVDGVALRCSDVGWDCMLISRFRNQGSGCGPLAGAGTGDSFRMKTAAGLAHAVK